MAKALSFALGKRFAVAKLTASLSARAKLRPRLLVASGRLIPSPEIQVSTGKDLLIPRGRSYPPSVAPESSINPHHPHFHHLALLHGGPPAPLLDDKGTEAAFLRLF